MSAGPLRILLCARDSASSFVVQARLAGIVGQPTDVHFAAWPSEARSTLSAIRFDAIILLLEGLDAPPVEVIRTIRAASGDTPLFALSASHDEERDEALRAAGADDVISDEESRCRLFSCSVLYAVEHRRAASERHAMELLLRTTPDAILVVSRSGVVRYVNAAALELFDREPEDFVGELLGFSVMDGEPSEVTILRKGEARTCEMRVATLDWEGEPAYLASIRDLTERVLAEELRKRADELHAQNQQIQEASRLKTELIANMSHELRTPLNAIIGFSELLHHGEVPADSPEHREFLGRILENGKHLLDVVSDVLDISKVEAGKLDLRPEVLDLRSMIDDATRLPRVGEAVQVVTEVDAALTHVELDGVRLKQVLYNYLSNAFKFTPPGGRITVRAIPEDDLWFRLEVEDTGPGIQPADIGKLFTEFQQLEMGASKRHQGTGLGLAVTRRLVEVQGGSVGVSSTPGEGSVFHAILPRRMASESLDHVPPSHVRTAAPVLVVEPDASARERLVAILRDAGHEVEVVRTGAEAVWTCNQRTFAAMTLDLLLPDMNGFELLSAVRAGGRNRFVPAVIVTALPMGKFISVYSVHAVLRKPIERDALLGALELAGVRPSLAPGPSSP